MNADLNGPGPGITTIVVESCATMTPSRLAYSDAIMGLLIADGFDATLAYRAFLTLDSYVYGFTMQELSWPRPTSSGAPPVNVGPNLEHYPHFAEVMSVVMIEVGKHGFAHAYAEEFAFGLELVLDALEARQHERQALRRS
jgi:hypothetical protein